MNIWTVLCALLAWPLLISGAVMAVRSIYRQHRLKQEAAERKRFIDEQIRRSEGG